MNFFGKITIRRIELNCISTYSINTIKVYQTAIKIDDSGKIMPTTTRNFGIYMYSINVVAIPYKSVSLKYQHLEIYIDLNSSYHSWPSAGLRCLCHDL